MRYLRLVIGVLSIFTFAACAPREGATARSTPVGPLTIASTPSGTATAENVTVCSSVSSPIPGTDVSNYDPGTKWTTFQHSGNGFAFVKATEGLTFTSDIFASDWKSLKSDGILRGAYHFFHPADDPAKQARYFLEVVGASELDDLPPMLDWEVTDGVNSATQIKNAKTWLTLVEAATGKTPIVYVDPSFFNALGNPQGFESYPLFIAHYNVNCPSVPPPWTTWTFWQKKIGPVNGVESTRADVDEFNGSLAELNTFATTAN